nr:MAG TPA: hypothetical protein [Caudoviricetes sp.]
MTVVVGVLLTHQFQLTGFGPSFYLVRRANECLSQRNTG